MLSKYNSWWKEAEKEKQKYLMSRKRKRKMKVDLLQQKYFSNSNICILILSGFTFCGPSPTLWVFILKDVIICVG